VVVLVAAFVAVAACAGPARASIIASYPFNSGGTASNSK